MEDILESPLDFKTKSREIWGEIRSGTPFEQIQKDTGDYAENFYGSGNSEGINFLKLIRYIKDSERDHTLIFNWDDYDIPSTVQQYRVRDGEGGFVDHFKIIKNNIPFAYENHKKEKVKTAVSGILNKRVDYLEDQWGYRLKIDAKAEAIQASLWYYYEKTRQFRSDASDTPRPNDYRIENKYVAISLTSENLDDFCYLVKETEGEAIFKKLQSEISEVYLKKINETRKPEELDFLYENAPDFVFKNIIDELLFEDLRALLKWDQKKWFTDSSNAMMKIVLGFKDLKKLYEMLEQDPSFVLQLYREMDKSNPEMFGEMMSFLGILFCNKERDKRTILIPIGKKYSLDSDLFFDKNKKTLNISVFEKIKKVNHNDSMSNYVGGMAPAIPTGTITELKSIGSYPELHPLDMITIITDDGTSQTVAAIYVKYLSDVAEKEKIQNTFIVIVTLVSILVSAGALASGAGVFWSTMAVADIALGTVDLALRVDEIKKELSKYEAGKWFVDNWDAIYGVAGITMLSAMTVRGILTNGPLLLAKLTYQKGQLKNFVQSAIANAILNIEIANFTKNTFKYIPWEEIRKIKNSDTYGISGIIAQKMNKANVLMAVSEDAQTMALIYKGEAIAVGNGKSIKETLKNIFTFARKEKEIATHLDELADFAILKNTEAFLNVLEKVQKKQYLSKFLSIEEEAVILYYTTSAYQNLNKALRGLIELKKEYIAFKNLLNRALSKLPNSGYNRENNFLYRSFYMSEYDIKKVFIEGKIYLEKGFLSTSYDYDNFLKYWFRENPTHNVIMKVQGKNGKLVDDVSEIFEESEVIFRSGIQYDVIQVSKIDNPLDFDKKITQIILKER